MAAGSLAVPGSEYGPCLNDCSHSDCASTRRMADVACVHCEKPIGYESPFYNVTPDDEPVWTKLAHMTCELAAIEPKSPSR